MAPKIVEGVYRGGHVELASPPEGVCEGARVRVVFSETEDRGRSRHEEFDEIGRAFHPGEPPHLTRDEIDEERIRGLERRREVTDEERRDAGDRLMARLREGIDFGGSPYPSRESLYDRDDRA